MSLSIWNFRRGEVFSKRPWKVRLGNYSMNRPRSHVPSIPVSRHRSAISSIRFTFKIISMTSLLASKTAINATLTRISHSIPGAANHHHLPSANDSIKIPSTPHPPRPNDTNHRPLSHRKIHQKKS